MGVTGQHSMWLHADACTDLVHLLAHRSAGGMLATNRVGWMMARKQQSARVLLRPHALECGLEISELGIAYTGPSNNSRVFEGIAVDDEDTHKPCLKRELHAGLDLGRARQAGRPPA
jgi:hypothetical protein